MFQITIEFIKCLIEHLILENIKKYEFIKIFEKNSIIEFSIEIEKTYKNDIDFYYSIEKIEVKENGYIGNRNKTKEKMSFKDITKRINEDISYYQQKDNRKSDKTYIILEERVD